MNEQHSAPCACLVRVPAGWGLPDGSGAIPAGAARRPGDGPSVGGGGVPEVSVTVSSLPRALTAPALSGRRDCLPGGLGLPPSFLVLVNLEMGLGGPA